MRERRRFRRYEVSEFAKYTKFSDYAEVSSVATIKNISLGGICATLSSLVKRGDKLIIEFTLPYRKKLAAMARVVWAEPSEEGGGNTCGLKFIEVSSLPLLMGYIAYSRKMSDVA